MEPESQNTVKGLSQGGSVSTSDLIKNAHDKNKMNEVIYEMISKNDLNGNLKWHGKYKKMNLVWRVKPDVG